MYMGSLHVWDYLATFVDEGNKAELIWETVLIYCRFCGNIGTELI